MIAVRIKTRPELPHPAHGTWAGALTKYVGATVEVRGRTHKIVGLPERRGKHIFWPVVDLSSGTWESDWKDLWKYSKDVLWIHRNNLRVVSLAPLN